MENIDFAKSLFLYVGLFFIFFLSFLFECILLFSFSSFCRHLLQFVFRFFLSFSDAFTLVIALWRVHSGLMCAFWSVHSRECTLMSALLVRALW